jgi:hypothetical protein
MSKELQNEINNLVKTIHPIKKMKFAVKCVELVLPIFEAKYPSDKRPRLAFETAKKYLTLSSRELREITDNESERIFNESQNIYKIAEPIEETPEGQTAYAVANLVRTAAIFTWDAWHTGASMSDTISYIIKNISSIDESNLIIAKEILDGIMEEIKLEENDIKKGIK